MNEQTSKVFDFLVVQEVGGHLYIKAKDADEARTLAVELLDRGAAQVEPDTTADESYRIDDVRECGPDEKEALAFADDNATALEELND